MSDVLDTTAVAECRRRARSRKRRQSSKTVVFQKIHRGLYISHEWGMTLDHEATWSQDVGRKWILTWRESYMGLMAPSERKLKFDTIAEARAHANALTRG